MKLARHSGWMLALALIVLMGIACSATAAQTPNPPAAQPTQAPSAPAATAVPPAAAPTTAASKSPTYSAIIQSADACCTNAEVLSVSPDGKKWVFRGGGKLCPGKSSLSLGGNEFPVNTDSMGDKWKCYGAKFTINSSASVTIGGKTYAPGTKLTVDKALNLVEVSSWD